MNHPQFVRLLLGSSIMAVTILNAAEPYRFDKAFFGVWPKSTAIALRSEFVAAARQIRFTVAPGTPSAALYTYFPVDGQTRYQLSFDYQLGNFRTGAGAENFISVQFQSADGKSLKLPPLRHAFTPRVTPEGRARTATLIFETPPSAGQLQVNLLDMKAMSGDFTLSSVALIPTTAAPTAAIPPAYAASQAFWNCWPRNENVTVRFAKTVPETVFTVKNPGENPACYTYVNLNPGITYTLQFTLHHTALRQLPDAAATVRVDFLTAQGKPSGDGGLHFPLQFTRDAVQHFDVEFTVPKNSVRARIEPVSLKGIAGTFTITEFSVAPVLDAVTVYRSAVPPDAASWQDAQAATRFYPSGASGRADVKTEARLTYDRNNLYVFLSCFDAQPDRLVARTEKRDGPVWMDDSVELFLAPERGRAVQLLLNARGVGADGEVHQPVPGDPWQTRLEWDGQWRGHSTVTDQGWQAEFTVPFADLDMSAPRDGATIKLNIVRNRRGDGTAKGPAQWNLHSGKLNNIDKFATLSFHADSATLTRFREPLLAEPLAVSRKNPKFAELPRRADGRCQLGSVISYNLATYSPAFQAANQATWPERQAQMLAAADGVCDMAPIGFPWAMNFYGGVDGLKKLIATHRYQFAFSTHNTGHDREAQQHGATFVTGRFTNAADPAVHAITMRFIRQFLTDHAWIIPHLAFAISTDEPTNTIYESFSLVKNSANAAALQTLDATIRRDYGFGKYGLFDHFAANADPEAGFRRIAFFRWWNATMIRHKREERDLIKKLAPSLPYLPGCFNTVAAFRGIEAFPDFAPISDFVSVDPYPTSCFSSYGRARAIYHTGFTTKLAKELSPGAKTRVYVQNFNYHGLAPRPADLREWAAQALKNGADAIAWYSDANLETAPGCYEEALRIAKIIRAMKPLALPEKSNIGMFYSFIAAWGGFDTTQNSYYTLYAILGETLQSNFKFISDLEVDDQRRSLANYRLVLAPALAIVTAATAEKLIEYVRNGGQLVVFDPAALEFSPDGAPLTAARMQLIGVPVGAAFKAAAPRTESMPGLAAGTLLPLGDSNRPNARRITAPPAGARILARFADGTVAAYSRRLGAGSVTYFAVNPFPDAGLSEAPGAWKGYFAALAQAAGEPAGMDFWNFLIPEK